MNNIRKISKVIMLDVIDHDAQPYPCTSVKIDNRKNIVVFERSQ